MGCCSQKRKERFVELVEKYSFSADDVIMCCIMFITCGAVIMISIGFIIMGSLFYVQDPEPKILAKVFITIGSILTFIFVWIFSYETCYIPWANRVLEEALKTERERVNVNGNVQTTEEFV